MNHLTLKRHTKYKVISPSTNGTFIVGDVITVLTGGGIMYREVRGVSQENITAGKKCEEAMKGVEVVLDTAYALKGMIEVRDRYLNALPTARNTLRDWIVDYEIFPFEITDPDSVKRVETYVDAFLGIK
jgi:hypothetical protein